MRAPLNPDSGRERKGETRESQLHRSCIRSSSSPRTQSHAATSIQMILRTYSRRSRGDAAAAAAAATSSSDSEDEHHRIPFSQDSYAQAGESYGDQYGLEDLFLGSQSRSQDDEGRGEAATLMEAQECGEMMEHMDEVNFALDGLRPRQPVRVRRASLLSLLNVCAGAHQRRLLRAQGTMTRIIDAVLGLNLDDSPSTIASAALFYILASDAQDDLLLDSPPCVQFLIKLLNPPTSDAVMDKAPSIGSRFMLIRPPEIKNGINKRLDSGATSIILKVQEILLHCEEIKPSEKDEGIERPELTSKWIGLLTMEKACLSTVSFEDISGTAGKVGGDFKEKLRELGGLDAVIDIAVTCYSTMEGCLKEGISTIDELKGVLVSENVVLFLKCLKIMENATFLSKENQNHLLQVTLKLDRESHLSCVELIMRAIQFFSGLLIRQKSFISSQHAKFSQLTCETANSIPEAKEVCQENQSRVASNSSAGCPGVPGSTPSKNFEAPSKRQRLSRSKKGYSMQVSETTSGSASPKKGDDNTFVTCKTTTDGFDGGVSVSIDETKGNLSKGSNKWISINGVGSKLGKVGGSGVHFQNSSGSKMNSGSLKKFPVELEECSTTSPDGHFDPYAFDEDELEPSKWDSLTMPRKTSQTQKSTRTHQTAIAEKSLEDRTTCKDMDKVVSDGLNHKCLDVDKSAVDGFTAGYDEPIGIKECHSNEEPCAGSATVEDPNLLEDCLLSAVKVLMNLTNDNLIGCQQIGSHGGLDTMASLIVNHFPAFGSNSSQIQEKASLPKKHDNSNHLTGIRLTDHELDFLVAILGLLVNLVEKDSNNRSRLVCTRIPAAEIERLENLTSSREIIHLLCSIFLVNQGPERAADNGEICLPCNNEATLLQGEREAEMMIVEAYAALLLAFLSTESKKARESIADCLPNRNLRILVPVLERFVEFHLSLNMISPETHTAVCEVIESCRIP